VANRLAVAVANNMFSDIPRIGTVFNDLQELKTKKGYLL
jgi:hypothetical protein